MYSAGNLSHLQSSTLQRIAGFNIASWRSPPYSSRCPCVRVSGRRCVAFVCQAPTADKKKGVTVQALLWIVGCSVLIVFLLVRDVRDAKLSAGISFRTLQSSSPATTWLLGGRLQKHSPPSPLPPPIKKKQWLGITVERETPR